ncbi:MAG: ubiquitin-like domain-containing protein [Oscillospiraceae bacterium]|nr:ubiquitin-like domain-containing protein [Oscillospiraceae bacterium]
MLELTAALMSGGRKIRKVKNALQNRTAISLLSIFITCIVIFMMTGALYFRNEVTITDDGNTFKVYTTRTAPEEILREQGIPLTGADYYNLSEPAGSGRMNAMTLSVTRSHTAAVMVDGKVLRAEAYTGETVAEVLDRAGIKLERNDIVTPALYEKITGESSIIISRAFGITLYIEGVTLSIPVSPLGEATIADVLSLEGIELSENDVVSENLNSVAYPGMEAAVNTLRYVERVETNLIPYDIISEPSNLVAIGKTEVVTAGAEGIERLTVVDTVKDGEVIATEIITREVLSEPVTEELLTGLAFSEPYSKREFDEIELIDGVPVNFEFMLSGKSTAYTAGPTCSTASGRPLVVGSVAVDPRRIPYGSLLYIVTQCGEIVYGAAVASDTGSFIYSTDVIVDVYMGLTDDNLVHAINWGSRMVDVYVISTGQY